METRYRVVVCTNAGTRETGGILWEFYNVNKR